MDRCADQVFQRAAIQICGAGRAADHLLLPKFKSQSCSMRQSSEKEDRLSGLPIQLKEVILGYLSVTEAVRTSVLSTEWRHVWRGLSKLVFDTNFWWKFWQYRAEVKSKAVTEIIRGFHGPVREFYLVTDNLHSNVDARMWLQILSEKRVENVEINDHYRRPTLHFSIPLSIFKCVDIKRVRICCCVISPPDEFTGFPNLVSLDLSYVYIQPKFLENLIRQCPLLETLTITPDYYTLLESGMLVVINSPSLKTLELHNVYLGLVSLENVPNLSNLSLLGRSKFHQLDRQKPCKSSEFMSSLVGIMELSYEFYLLEPLNGNCPTRLPSELKSLNRLVLVNFDVHRWDDISFGLCLIRSSSKLQFLRIQLATLYGPKWSETEKAYKLLESQTREHSVLSNVSTVWIQGVTVHKHYIMLIKIVLLRCPDLQSLFIVPSYNYNKMEEASTNITRELINCSLYSDKVHFINN